MNVKILRAIIVGAAMVFLLAFSMLSVFSAGSTPEWKIDEKGNFTVDGKIYYVQGGSWFGLEGRHEPSNDSTNPSGAPMELYIGNVFWASSSRTHDSDIAEFKQLGINTIRLPIVPQTLNPDDPQAASKYKKNTTSVRYDNSYLELVAVLKKLDAAGINVMLDMHSCSNYLGWRAGRFDARPPYADKDRTDYDFKREDCSCSATNNPSGVTKIQAYDKTKWLADLKKMAGFNKELGIKNVMAIDIFNEPFDFTWSDWKTNIEDAYKAISAVDPNIIVVAEGIGQKANEQDGTPDTTIPSPHGDEDTNPNWGENLYEAGSNPPNIPKSKLAFSPHTYGPSVFVQKMFMDPKQPECKGLSDLDAAKNKCNIVIDPTILEKGWDEHFGYLKAMGYAVVIGEWGGNMYFPDKADERMQKAFSYLTDKTTDWQWQQTFAKYLIKRGIKDNFYWALNPESGDAAGLYEQAYDAKSNPSGWGTWTKVNQDKLTMLKSIWSAAPVTYNPVTTGPVTTPPSGTVTLGDVNGDGKINTTDVSLVERHVLGITELTGNKAIAADVNKDGKINTTDSAKISRYALGIADSVN